MAVWLTHYNGERPHTALGPGLPNEPTCRSILTGHRLSHAHRVLVSASVGGLHHDYRLDRVAASVLADYTLTDLLIGDLLHDRVDKVWGPLECQRSLE